jgi:hypothetical protein
MNSVENSVRDSVWNSVRNSVRNSVMKMKLIDYVYPYIDGNFMVSYFSFYEYMEKELNINFKCNDNWEWYKDTTNQSLVYPLDNICIFADKFMYLKRNSSGQLHSDGSPCIEYKDGYKLWYLNGIDVGENIVMTPSEKLNPELVLKEKNADIQREIIRKIGAERCIKKLGATELDIWTDPKTNLKYKLLNFKLNNIDRKYMYFEHAGLKNVWYAKPVPPEVKKASYGRAWILSMIEQNELANITQMQELEIEANLPLYVS